ncbi:HigA family addiction module antitoxin [Cerasicoccus frondis]|uniref:HigA family addiction module antitoxin n=1 Tax=Cerasicoccus frondis TaxID=490090 RepID=UPI0028525B35|nr:HigA family addiction module antitoxin [Cerasicoccus frondis]
MTQNITHPGEDLLSVIEEMGITRAQLARGTGIPASRITEIIKGKHSITAEHSLRLGRFFGQSDAFWLNMQRGYELRKAKAEKGKDIEREVVPLSA